MGKLALNSKSSAALREFAAVMPMAVQNIVQDTEALFTVYQSVEQGLGVHEPQFIEMLKVIKNAQQLADEAIMELPDRLQKTANKIDDYVAKQSKMVANAPKG